MRTRDELTTTALALLGTPDENGNPYRWRSIAQVLCPGEVSGALLWKVVNRPEYEPSQEVCERLGIQYKVPTPVCPRHGVVHCYDCENQRVVRRTKPRQQYKDLFSIPTSTLADMLVNRTEY